MGNTTPEMQHPTTELQNVLQCIHVKETLKTHDSRL